MELKLGLGIFDQVYVSILTRGKPRVERWALQWPALPPLFQSSLEGNPEWNHKAAAARKSSVSFNPHSRETPSGTVLGLCVLGGLYIVSILTRGKPRVEHDGAPRISELRDVSILTRGKPRVEQNSDADGDGIDLVSILTRGKPRVERTSPRPTAPTARFQSSLEGNPEWNAMIWPRTSGSWMFQSSLEGNPEWNPRAAAGSSGPG